MPHLAADVAKSGFGEPTVSVWSAYMAPPVAADQDSRHEFLVRREAWINGDKSAVIMEGNPGKRQEFARLHVLEVMKESAPEHDIESRQAGQCGFVELATHEYRAFAESRPGRVDVGTADVVAPVLHLSRKTAQDSCGPAPHVKDPVACRRAHGLCHEFTPTPACPHETLHRVVQ